MKVRFTAISRHEIVTFDAGESTVIVGRERSCDHPLDDPALERRHIALTQTGTTVQVTDLQTRAGTFLNGRRVERADLSDGDRVRVGDTVLIVTFTPELNRIEDANPDDEDSPPREPLVADDERFFIRIAKDWGLLDRPLMRSILWVKSNNRLLGDERRVEEICVHKGFLTVGQVREIINIWERMVIICRTCSSVFTPKDLGHSRRLVCPACSSPLRGTLDFPGEVEADRNAAAESWSTAETRVCQPGEIFAGCRIERFIDEGGSAEVYAGIHIALQNRVAIKVLKRTWATAWEQAHRFVEEARRVARLDHPHIVQVVNVGFERGRYFIIYQFIEGRTLSELLQEQGALSPDRARYITAAIASGLNEAHRHGLIHGDVKPENILVGRNRVVKVTDFGVAVDVDRAQGTRVRGTHLYGAPEQESGEPVDRRADIYSLGLIFRAMLLGEPAPEDHRYVDLVPPHENSSSVPESLSLIVTRMLAKNPEDRFQSMRQLIDALRVAETEPHQRPPQKRQSPKQVRSPWHKFGRALVSLTLLLIAGLIGALVTMPEDQRDRFVRQWLSPFDVPLSEDAEAGATGSTPTSDSDDVNHEIGDATKSRYRPPQAEFDKLQEAFQQRDFDKFCELLEALKDDSPEAKTYRDALLENSSPLRQYQKISANETGESFIAKDPITFSEYRDFLLPYANGSFIEKHKAGWWNPGLWDQRRKDLQYGGKPEEPFTYASYFEAAAYCDWLTAHPELTGLKFRFRLPESSDVRSVDFDTNFWLGDPPEPDGKYWIYNKNHRQSKRQRPQIDVPFDSLVNQPTIRPVVDVEFVYIDFIKNLLEGGRL